MSDWLQRLFGRRQEATESGDERLLALERQVQDLRLALREQEQSAKRLQEELERQRSGAQGQVAETLEAQREQLLGDLAAPVAQLLTQAHLWEMESKPVSAGDVLAVARRLVRALEDHGLTVEGRVGQTVPFDPARHAPLSGAATLVPGQRVVLRFVGLAYRGKLLRKAGVERAEE